MFIIFVAQTYNRIMNNKTAEGKKELKIIHAHITEEDFAALKALCETNSRTIKGQLIHWIRNGQHRIQNS